MYFGLYTIYDSLRDHFVVTNQYLLIIQAKSYLTFLDFTHGWP
jgi:hypothetical protein